jgi:hypothetical protein
MSAAPKSKRRPHGRVVRCAGGYSAYVPTALPPPIAWDERLAAALSDADRAIGRLAGEGRRLPNPHVLIRPFLRREAVLSSRIEGTQATLGELLASEAGVAVERSPADLREVANYVAALEYGVARLSTLPLSLRLVRELHEKLMHGVRGDAATPGEFRRSQNWVGPAGCTPATATFVPPPPEQLMDCLGAWEQFLHDDSLPPLVHAALAHYYGKLRDIEPEPTAEELAAVFMDDGPADPQSKPGVLRAVFRGEERIEHALLPIRRHAGTVVGHGETPPAAARGVIRDP